MANTYTFSIVEVDDPNLVGVGTGAAPNGELRICISLEGRAINPGLDESWTEVNWRALTPACAKELYKLLGTLEHLWATDTDG